MPSASPSSTRRPSLPTPPRWARYLGVGLVLLVLSLVFGVTTASTHASLGPHNALYEVTTDSIVTVDVGPLGTVQLKSPLPLSLGAKVTIEEIPNDLTAVDSAQTLNALAGDVQGYLQFFSGPAETVSYVATALAQDAVRRAAFMFVGLVAVGIAGYFVLGSSRRRELGEPLVRSSWAIAAGVVVAVVASSVVVTQRAGTSLDEVGAQASAVFDGTALEGARITGRLSGVIDTYGGQLVEVYRSNESFYQEADANLTRAWEARAEQIAAQEALLRANGVSGGVDGGGSAGHATDAAAGSEDAVGGETGSTSPGSGTSTPGGDDPDVASGDRPLTPVPDDPTPEDDSVVTLLMVSDLHCNTGMSPLIRNAATLSGASVILNGGDSTINGTAVERFCVDSFVGSAPKGVTWVQADGNHDSSITSEQARSAGAVVLDGSVVEVEGIRILGDSDPNETRIGQGSSSVDGETYQEAGERLRDVACETPGSVDILLIHTPGVGEPSLVSGCVPIQLSGHQHRRSGPLQYSKGIRYVSSTTAGAAEGQATIGPLNGTAEMTVFRYDTERHVMLDYQVIAVRTDASVEVGERMTFPLIPGTLEARAAEQTQGSESTGGTGGTGGTESEAPGDPADDPAGDPAETDGP